MMITTFHTILSGDGPPRRLPMLLHNLPRLGDSLSIDWMPDLGNAIVKEIGHKISREGEVYQQEVIIYVDRE